jgi:hypothetical protein
VTPAGVLLFKPLDGSMRGALEPSLTSFVAACNELQPSAMGPESAARLQTLLDKCRPALQRPELTGGAIRAVATACAACIDRLLQPVVSQLEQFISKPESASSMRSSSWGAWDTFALKHLQPALQAAAAAAYPSSALDEGDPSSVAQYGSKKLAVLGTVAKPLAQALALLQSPGTGCASGPALLARFGLEQAGVPSVVALVAMLGVLLFRRVLLESQVCPPDCLQSLAGVMQGPASISTG